MRTWRELDKCQLANKRGGSIRSHGCYLKRCVKNSFTQYSFYLMESRVSNKCTRNIYRPFTPEKEVNRKENSLGKIAKRRQTATDSKVYAYVDIELGEVLFRFVIFCDKENRNLARFIAFPSAEFPKIYWTVKHIYALPSVC